MGRSTQWCALYWGAFLYTIVPNNNLTGISTAEDEIWLEFSEACRHHGALAVEDILWCLLLVFGIPYYHNTIGFVGRFLSRRLRGEFLLPSIQKRVHDFGEGYNFCRHAQMRPNHLPRCCGMKWRSALDNEWTSPLMSHSDFSTIDHRRRFYLRTIQPAIFHL